MIVIAMILLGNVSTLRYSATGYFLFNVETTCCPILASSVADNKLIDVNVIILRLKRKYVLLMLLKLFCAVHAVCSHYILFCGHFSQLSQIQASNTLLLSKVSHDSSAAFETERTWSPLMV
jgi:hypothetical protein